MTDDDSLRAARKRWQSRLAEERHACLMTEEAGYAEAVSKYLYHLSSEQGAPEMVSLLERASPDAFWKVFMIHWPNCDDTWALKDRLLSQLRKAAGAASAIRYYGDEQRAFFESLPQVLTVYRGCSRQRAAGISWTTETKIAMQFARGHRQITVPEPVIVTAEVDKNDIFAVFTDRSENEIVCTPSRILKIENLTNAERSLRDAAE
ncbi:hypothetical protein [Bradyrhizobium sp. AZCC 2289]|uniref:hypothetical protein n=1 Tax=Bradyrhizobium sp. AZCC 2289 TaxID=3117026 RepID=UPI002FF31A70